MLIKPIENYEECLYVSKTLHNCMARLYAKPYAEKKTELYYASIDQKPLIAIEVNKRRLMQVRADNNRDPEPKEKRVVTKWFKEVRLA